MDAGAARSRAVVTPRWWTDLRDANGNSISTDAQFQSHTLRTTNADTIALDSTQPQGAVMAISAALTPVLAQHGEVTLISGLALAIGNYRIAEATTAKPSLTCEAVNDRGHATPLLATPTTAKDTEGASVHYYIAGCPGLKKLSHRFRRAVFKIGMTTSTRDKRLAGLDEVAYGGWSGNAAPTAPPSPGWSDWTPARHEPTDVAHIVLPDGVTIEAGVWTVHLPAGVDPVDFDRIVTAAMTAREISFWAASGEGRIHCAQSGIDVDQFARFSRNPKNGALRKAAELYVYNPRLDASWFATILAEALAVVGRGVTSH